MDKKSSQAMGLIITLKKHMGILNREAETDSSGKFQSQGIAFGYYDTFDIHAVDDWYDLRPKGVDDRNGTVSLRRWIV